MEILTEFHMLSSAVHLILSKTHIQGGSATSRFKVQWRKISMSKHSFRLTKNSIDSNVQQLGTIYICNLTATLPVQFTSPTHPLKSLIRLNYPRSSALYH